MKKIYFRILLLALSLLLLFSFAACNQPADSETEKPAESVSGTESTPQSAPEFETALDPNDPWNDAIYTENKEFGEGAKTCTVKVTVGNHNVTFTLHTDEEFLGAVLLSHELITGEEGPYGIYMETVNGVRAVWEEDGTYWALYINGAYGMTGVDTTPIADGDSFELRRS